MADIPNLAGVATQDLVEQIGTGRYSASYINWSRTMHLLRTHAPGWMVETIPAGDGGLLHRAPVGGYLLIRFVHVDGTATPAVPQAVMDNRNAAIPCDKITSRDITDTQRRGACMAAAMVFGLAYELWAKMPLESGYYDDRESAAPSVAPKAASTAPSATQEQFLEAAIEKGLTTHAADALASKLNGNWAGGIARLAEKDKAWVKEFNQACAPKEPEKADPKDNAEQW